MTRSNRASNYTTTGRATLATSDPKGTTRHRSPSGVCWFLHQHVHQVEVALMTPPKTESHTSPLPPFESQTQEFQDD
jgi:hypothetical protein